MKLQYLAVIFVIIMLPITLILSQYIQTQIDMVNIRNNYTTSLINSTHDAMVAYELNSMNNNYNEDANSKKRDVQASINTFFNSLSNNLGVPGYTEKYVQPYIPAVIFTGYDGYYIYAKTTELERKGANTNEEGEIIQDSPGKAKQITDYNLKPYIYYSAQYDNGKSGNNNINVIINYTLDNYITVYGNVKGEYISESGYLGNAVDLTDSEELIENVKCIKKVSRGVEDYYSKDNCIYYYTYSPLNKTIQKIYYDTNSNKYFSITSSGYYNEININTNNYEEINDFDKWDFDNIKTTYIIKNTKILNDLYKNNIDKFKTNVIEKINTLTSNDMVVNDNGTRGRLEKITDTNNPYYSLKSDKKIFGDNLINFNDHKQDIIKISIQENLKSALANYSNGVTTYKLPIFKEEDWQKIFSNITMITFMQDLPVKNGTYNNYVIATSTGNKEYVPADGIYFIDKKTNIYHRITCEKLKEAKEQNHSIIGHKALEFERNSVKIDGKDQQNYYPHNVTACYDCIVSSNYESLYKQNGDLNIEDDDLKKIYNSALARERVTQYKATKYLTSY